MTVFAAVIVFMLILTACDFVQPEEPECKHNFGQWQTVVAPSCIEQGEDLRICLLCGKEESIETQALGHIEVIDVGAAASCIETGLTDGKHCSRCNEVLAERQVIGALGHSEAIDAAVTSTCTETGLTEGKHCSRCETILLAQQEIPALGHVEETDEAVTATCTQTGLTTGKHCSRCGLVLLAQEVLPIDPSKHHYVTVVIPAEEYTWGYSTHTCSFCKDEYVTDMVCPTNLDEGLSFADKTERYSLTSTFDTYPKTFEAYLDCSSEKTKKYGFTILSNYFDEYVSGVSFKLTNVGKPSLLLRYDRRDPLMIEFPASVLGKGRVFVAISIDDEYISCYLNGELVSKTEYDGTLPVLNESVPFSVGGDISERNAEWFRGGSIYNLNVFNSCRTQEQIISDMDGVSIDDQTLLVSFDFTKSLTDRSYNDNDLYNYYFDKEFLSSENYDYTFAVVGDTQALTYSFPETMEPLYQWIVDNKEDLKIERVIGVGDITDHNYDREWELAYSAIHKLDGVVPYSLVRGNHDVFAYGDEQKAQKGEDVVQSENFNRYFDDELYGLQYTGAYNGDIKNTYFLTQICGIKYLFINLDYGPSDEVLSWAGSLCETYSDFNVVFSTHGFLFRDGTTLDSTDFYAPSFSGLGNDGDDMWEKLISKYENVSLVICGHDPNNNMVVSKFEGDNGNEVTCLLINQQYTDAHISPSGMVSLLHFSDEGTTITVETYSTVNDKFYKLNNQVVISGINVK